MQTSYTVTVSKTDAGFVALVAKGAEPWTVSETLPSVDAVVLDALRLIGEADPEADAEILGVENGSLVAV